MKFLLAILAVTMFAASAYATDEPPALAALRQSAEQGNRDAQLEIGILYEFGYRMPDNLVPALAWYLRAAEQGSEQAARRRDALMGSMKATEVEEAKKLAADIASKQSTVRSAAPAPAPAPAEPPAETPKVADPIPQGGVPEASEKPSEPKPQ